MWFSSSCFLKLNSDCYDIQHRFMGVINKKNKIKKKKLLVDTHVMFSVATLLICSRNALALHLWLDFVTVIHPDVDLHLWYTMCLLWLQTCIRSSLLVCVCVCSLKSDIRSLRCNTFSLISLTKQDNDSHETPSASLCLPCHSLHKRRHGDQSQMCSPHTAILFIQLSLTAPP